MNATHRMVTLAAGILIAVSATAGAAAAQLAAAPDVQTKARFTAERFTALQNQNALVLLDVFATWCPTCAQQQKILDEYRKEHPDVPIHTLTIDFDDQKEYVTRFKAPRQSTLILYRGTERVWFSVAETRRDVIFAELNKVAKQSR